MGAGHLQKRISLFVVHLSPCSGRDSHSTFIWTLRESKTMSTTHALTFVLDSSRLTYHYSQWLIELHGSQVLGLAASSVDGAFHGVTLRWSAYERSGTTHNQTGYGANDSINTMNLAGD